MPSNHTTYRTATIRNPNGTVFGTARYKFLKRDNYCVQAGIWIDDTAGNNLASAIYPMRDHREGQKIDSFNLPDWLTSPSSEALHHLASLPDGPDGGHNDNPNLVAFAIHRRDGALVTRLDFDAYGPYGLRFGLNTAPVPLKEGQETGNYTSLREKTALEGLNTLLGTTLSPYHLMHVDDVYDPDNGRFIHVYKPTHNTLESMLNERGYALGKHTLNGNATHAVYDAVRSLVNDMTSLRTGDLTAEMADKLDHSLHFTPQLRYIAAAFPSILPQLKQAAA